MDLERDSGLMSAPESELLHEVSRLRCALEAERLRSYELSLELTRERAHRMAYEALMAPPRAVA
jgi:hypothetical protein